jgi:hydrophobic/amphiphilic exporter-1 (mainly G- bacteria), HAE1 family
MLSGLWFKAGQAIDNRFFNTINRGINYTRDRYASVVDRVIRRKNLVLGLFAIALVATYWLYTVSPKAFIPEEDQGYFITVVQAPEGVSLGYTEKVLSQAEEILKAQPEVKNIFSVGGFSFSGATPNNGLIFCLLKPWSERPGQSVASVIGGFFPQPTGLFPKLLGIQEATVIPFAPPAIQGLGNFGGFEFHLQDRTGVGFPAIGETLGKFLGRASAYPTAQNPQLTGLRPTFNANTPQITVEVDRVRANQLQVPIQDIFNTLQILLGSTYVNDFNQFQRTYRVYVQADQQFRSNPEDIKKLYVRSQTGSMIPLSNLVKITQTVGPSIISHYNLSRSVEINGAAPPGGSSGQAIAAMEAVAKEVLPRGFGYEWSGISLEEVESGGAAVFIFGLGIIFVFLTLSAQYENYVDPLIIMLTVPLAIFGALIAIMLKGTANDVYTQVGFVMLIGMASKNAILIVEFANQLREKGLSLAKAATEACRDRLRPILMTAISTIVGALPLMIATGPGAAARQSLGTAIVGGMCVATFLSLFVVPVLYIAIKSLEDRLRKKPRSPDTPIDPTVDGHGDPKAIGPAPELTLSGRSSDRESNS